MMTPYDLDDILKHEPPAVRLAAAHALDVAAHWQRADRVRIRVGFVTAIRLYVVARRHASSELQQALFDMAVSRVRVAPRRIPSPIRWTA